MGGISDADMLCLIFKSIDKTDLVLGARLNSKKLRKCQDIINLFQTKVLHLGFWYKWGVIFPSCTDLTESIRRIKNFKQIDTIDDNYCFSDEAMEKVNSFKVLISKIEEINKEWGLSIASELCYLIDRNEKDPIKDKLFVLGCLYYLKPKYDKSNCESIYSLLFEE